MKKITAGLAIALALLLSKDALSDPIATYSTEVYPTWHLDAKTLKNMGKLDVVDAKQMKEYAFTLAFQAAIWGAAPVTLYSLRYNDALSPHPKAKPNSIWYMEDISTPALSEEAGYVTPNVNTLYGFGFMDLRAEPVILTAPDSNGRYYMVEIIDMYSNAFAYVGGVSTGYEGGQFVLVGPGWKGTLPAGLKVIHSPTPWLLLQPRVHVKNPEDLAAARTVLTGITTEKLSTFLGQPAPATPTATYITPDYLNPKLPVSFMSFKDPLQFWEILSAVINENPPPKSQIKALLPLFAPLGIELGKQWNRNDVMPEILEAMKEVGQNMGPKYLGNMPAGRLENGWYYLFPSTGNFGTDYLTRALVTRWGLTANTPEEAIYIAAQFDNVGQPLSGGKQYTITFKELPPYKKPGFWSLTLYNSANNYTIPNNINRYNLGSDNDMKFNADGSLTLYIQTTHPGADKEANWLPSPATGLFYLVLRTYPPGKKMIESVFYPSAYIPPEVIEVK